jgi:hypothetical protein
MQVTGGPADHPKLGLAKGIIQSFINTTDGVRFGAMIFNYNEGGHILEEIKDMTPQNRAALRAAIGWLHGEFLSEMYFSYHSAQSLHFFFDFCRG